MFPSEEDSLRLLASLSESYAVEVKRWIDPGQPEGQAKLIKALMALRNNGGGRLVVGFDNETMKPVDEDRPKSVRATFAQDEIQALVSRFASDPFEVLVQYINLDFAGTNAEFPVICAPSGVRRPVAMKSELKASDSQKPLIPLNAVYVRTLSSNNTVSTANAQWRDWDRLIDVCFDNREADLGRFVRRHLSELDLSVLSTALTGTVAPPKVDASTVCESWMGEGHAAFERAVKRSGMELPNVGGFEIAVVIDGGLIEGIDANRSMLNLITTANRHLTGWPMFVPLQNADDAAIRPNVVADAWETAVFRPGGNLWGLNGVDFWRIQPDGKLYAIRAYGEDFYPPLEGKRVLGVVPAIRHVADGMAEALAIAKQMVQRPENATLAIRLRWTDLVDRVLSNVFSQRFWPYLGGASIDSDATSFITVPVDLPDSALAAHVERALAPLFRRFQGFEVSREIVDAEVQKVLNEKSH
jgi:hypothetical protein